MGDSNKEHKSSYFGVFKGHVPGVYDSIESLTLVTSGYSGGAVYREFDNFEDACLFSARGELKSIAQSLPNTIRRRKQTKFNQNTEQIKHSNVLLSNSKTSGVEGNKISKLADHISAWKTEKERFKEYTVDTALYAKSVLEERGDLSPENDNNDLVNTLQHLSLDLNDLIDTTKVVKD